MVGPTFGLGIYANVSLGTYDRVSIDGVDVSGGYGVHGWAQVGLRSTIAP